jgi:hypothetical protein
MRLLQDTSNLEFILTGIRKDARDLLFQENNKRLRSFVTYFYYFRVALMSSIKMTFGFTDEEVNGINPELVFSSANPKCRNILICLMSNTFIILAGKITSCGQYHIRV